jgi:hypothetical protein
MRLRTLVLAAGLPCPASGFSQEVPGFASGNSLSASVYCHAYIQGASDAVQTTARALHMEYGPFCLPREIQAGQITDVVINYLRTHPEEQHYSAADEVSLALMTTFPCK